MDARHLAAALGAALLAGIAPGTASAGDPIMPLSELRPGMQCTGYSVIRGTEISAFDVEIVDVVSGDASANDGPRILIRVSGEAVDRTGVGPGFSGSPIYCGRAQRRRDLGGDRRVRRQDRAGDADRGDPLQPARRAPRQADRAAASRIGRVLPLAEPLTVSGLNRGLARQADRGGREGAAASARRPRDAAHARSPPSPPRPGSAMSVGYSSGDLAVGAVGTVAYVDGDRVWGFGHPFENSGLRALLLQDAYVYTVISNPNAGDDTGSTYKLAAVGHDLGTISNDASAAVVGRSGATPPTVPVRIFSHDEDTGEQSTLGLARGRRDRRRHADRRLGADASSRRSRSPRAPRRSCAARPASSAARSASRSGCASASGRCGSATATCRRSRPRTPRRARTSSPPAAPPTRSPR